MWSSVRQLTLSTPSHRHKLAMLVPISRILAARPEEEGFKSSFGETFIPGTHGVNWHAAKAQEAPPDNSMGPSRVRRLGEPVGISDRSARPRQ